MSSIEDQVASARAALFSNCPRCGLSIRPKARGMAVEHCPRCLARARVAVKMFSSRLRAPSCTRGPRTRSRQAGRSHSQSDRFKIMSEPPPIRAERAEHRSPSPIRLLPSPRTGAEPLRIAMLAPPWIPVPPQGYGGIEAVVDLLCEALVERAIRRRCWPRPVRIRRAGASAPGWRSSRGDRLVFIRIRPCRVCVGRDRPRSRAGLAIRCLARPLGLHRAGDG